MPLTSGAVLGPYRVVALIGAGGMGEVYRAHDERLGRDLALKLLPPEHTADGNARSRLVREARTASSLNHPHIAHIYEVGDEGGTLYIAMELIEGRSLYDLIRAERMDPAALAEYADQVA